MATAIKAIPTLYGEEARRFQEMANEVEDNYDPQKIRVMTPRQQSAYDFLKHSHARNRQEPNCIAGYDR